MSTRRAIRIWLLIFIVIGVFRDPVRNVWIIVWGMIACVAVIPLALIAGPIRGIPWGWTLIDCSFGIVGIVPLIIVYRLIRRLESERARGDDLEPQPAGSPSSRA